MKPLVERELVGLTGADRVTAWIEKFCVTPKGKDAKKPLKLRMWQADLIAQCFDSPRPRIGMWSLPRGNGKSSLAAALGLYALFGDGVEGASVCLVASDERQARIVFNTACRMVRLNPKLKVRSYIYRDYIAVPRTGSTMQVLPAEADRLEGLDPSLMIIDEIGVVDRSTWEVCLLASGKRETSLTLAIGTPSRRGLESVMWDLRSDALAHPDDPSFRYTEFSAPPNCDLDDEEAWRIANPALDDFLYLDSFRASLPPKTRESEFRRARLGQWSDADDSWIPAALWGAQSTGEGIPDGTPVVLALDGSFNGDHTAITAVTISSKPHADKAGHWYNPGQPDWRVDVLEVEEHVRMLCKKWRVKEIVCDPYRWQRSIQLLAREGLPMVEFPQSAPRMTPATTGVYEAVVNGQLTHSGDKDLTAHVLNARVKDDANGTRLAKEKRDSPAKIDLAVALLMAHSRAMYHVSRKSKRSVHSW